MSTSTIGNRVLPSGRLRPEGLDDALISRILDDFYGKVRRDPVIGPIFNATIPDEHWPAHIAVIHDFWSSMLLGTGRYSGRPMPKHLALPDLGDAHFARWLLLFAETVEALAPIHVAELFIDRAERIAQSFRLSLALSRGEDSVGIEVMRVSDLRQKP